MNSRQIFRPTPSSNRFRSALAALILALPCLGQEPPPPDQGAEWISRIKGDSALTWAIPKKGLGARNIEGLWLTRHRDSTVGYVGKDYQRLRIRFLTVVREKVSPPVYAVTGKTMFREVICGFKGRLEVTEAKRFAPMGDSSKPRGVLLGTYRFNEDSACREPGRFQGIFTSRFMIDRKGAFHYDSLEMNADSYWNNAFVGTWKKPGDRETPVCNWGDYRIPFSDGLDIGAGEFLVAEEYLRFGWERYMSAVNGDKAAISAEADRWWE